MDSTAWTYNWTIHNFHCELATHGEKLPSTKFEFDLPNVKFIGKIYLKGDECKSRNCVLEFECPYDVERFLIRLIIGNFIDVYQNRNKKFVDFSLGRTSCALIEYLRNNKITITFEIKFNDEIYLRRLPKYLPVRNYTSHSYRIERKFTYKWSVKDFDCKKVSNAENLPSKKFEFDFGPDAKFSAQLYLQNDECEKRECILWLQCNTDHDWTVWVDIGFGDDVKDSYGMAFNGNDNRKIWKLFEVNTKECLLTKHLQNNTFTITCIITYVTYREHELSNLSTIDPAVLNETEMKALALENTVKTPTSKSEMSLLRSSDASHNCRIQRNFTYKWIIKDFDCKKVSIGENLPSKKFEFDFGPDAKFSAQLYLQNEECEKRECVLWLQCNTDDYWRVWVDIGFGDDGKDSYGMAFNEDDNKKIWKLFEVNTKECLLTKHLQNNAFTIICTITYATYQEHELTNLSTNETEKMSLTKLKTFDASHNCRIQRKFIYKWTLQNFDCTSVPRGDEAFKEFEVNFGPHIKFSGQLYIQGPECKKRICMLYLQSNTEDVWTVWVDLWLGDGMNDKHRAALNNISNKVSWDLYTNNRCRLDKYQRKNSFTITCMITYVAYEQQELSTVPTINQPAELNENIASPTDLITSDKSCYCRIEKKFTYKWIIKDFYCEKVTNGQVLPSTTFELDFGPNAKFSGELQLAGDYCKSRACILDLKSKQMDKWRVFVHLECVDNETCNYDYCRVLKNGFGKVNWGMFNTFRSKCIIEKCLRNNTTTSTITFNIFYVTYEETKLSTINPPELYESNMNYDVTFVVKGHKLQAHKSILADCSKVFAAMFEQEREEAKSDQITINDIDFHVFEEMLCFIYTGKLLKEAAQMLAVSDIYDLPQLKTICENELMEKVSSANAAEILHMADIYNVPKLKQHTIIYIKNNLVAVTATEGWHKLVKNHRPIIAEVWKQ